MVKFIYWTKYKKSMVRNKKGGTLVRLKILINYTVAFLKAILQGPGLIKDIKILFRFYRFALKNPEIIVAMHPLLSALALYKVLKNE